jgi:hypothetical protein
MYPSSTFCWAQAVRQRDLAEATLLENVRATALAAALAWEREALAADRREKSRDRQTAARALAAGAEAGDALAPFGLEEPLDGGRCAIEG